MTNECISGIFKYHIHLKKLLKMPYTNCLSFPNSEKKQVIRSVCHSVNCLLVNQPSSPKKWLCN